MNSQRKLSLLLAAALSLPLLVGCEDPSAVLDAVEPPVVAPSPSPSSIPVTEPSPKPTTSPSPKPTTSPIDATAHYTGPASLAKYIQKFMDDAKAQGVDVRPYMRNPKLVVRIASLDAWGTNTIGLCQSSSTVRRLTVDPEFWNPASETRRELLMHHELGHCVLDRRHRTTKLTSGAYASIMYPIIMSSTTYRNSYRYYQDEFFNKSYFGWNALMTAAMGVNGSEEETQHVCSGSALEEDAEAAEHESAETGSTAEAATEEAGNEHAHAT